MSAWTHVAAIARIDGYVDSDDMTKIFGKECLWDSDEKVWDDMCNNMAAYLPAGSEGTLRMIVWVNPDMDAWSRYTVSIFGDLRNYWDGHEIIDWFKDKLRLIEDGPCGSVRQACIDVADGYGSMYTWSTGFGIKRMEDF